MGGTDVAVAKDATITFGGGSKTTYSISGTVGDVMNFGEGYEEDTAAYKATIDVCDAEYTTLRTIDIDVSKVTSDTGIGTATFTVDGLEIGKQYYLYFMRAGACDKEVSLKTTISDDITNATVELWAGDPSGDAAIDSADVGLAVAASKNDTYDIECDADYDLTVNSVDVGILVRNAKNFANYSISFE